MKAEYLAIQLTIIIMICKFPLFATIVKERAGCEKVAFAHFYQERAALNQFDYAPLPVNHFTTLSINNWTMLAIRIFDPWTNFRIVGV